MTKQILLFGLCILVFVSCTSVSQSQLEPDPATHTTVDIECVGTTYFNIVDTDRPEILTDNPDDVRDIMIKVWYPALRSAEHDPVNMWFFTKEYLLPEKNSAGGTNKLKNMKSESYLNALPQKGSFPVIMYSHGYCGNGVNNQFLFEHLVKKGYIVVSVSHNYQANIMIESNGKARMYNYADRANDFYLSDDADINGEELNTEYYALRGKDLNTQEKARIYQLMEWAAGDHKWINYWIEDFYSALDTLELLNNGDNVELFNSAIRKEEFTDLFDLNRVLALGSSMGGIVSLDFSNRYENCIGAVNLDAVHYSLKQNGEYNKPYMYMHSDGGSLPAARLVLEQQTAPTYLVGVAGAKHHDFTDGTLISRQWLELGTIDGARMIQLMNESIGLFFDFCLDRTEKDAFDVYVNNQQEFSILHN